jgi:SanA protein
MKNYLLGQGVPKEDIFLDHAGFDTYDSMYRAKHVFQVEKAIVVTQAFHLPRAIWLGERLELEIYGLKADRREYDSNEHLKRREWLANVKAWYELKLGQEPTFAGPPIPITGSSAASHDQN